MTDDTEVVWEEASLRLHSDPGFGPLVREVGPVRLRARRGDPFQSLAASIIYQQLAGKAAASIHGRFEALFGGEVTPERVLALPEPQLRSAGLSGAKAAAILDLSRRVVNQDLDLDALTDLPEQSVVDRLVSVRGIGRWTAEMYLLFDLRRPDVWPTGDLGVRNGLGRVLGMPSAPTPKEAELIGIGYRPWRSALAWYCWRAVDMRTPE